MMIQREEEEEVGQKENSDREKKNEEGEVLGHVAITRII